MSSASTTTVSFWMDWNGTNNEMPISFGSNYGLYLDNGYFGFTTATATSTGSAAPVWPTPGTW